MVGKKFKIKLRPESYSEHSNALLRANDGKTCRLVEHLHHDLYVTDIDVPEGTPDNDYARGGKLLVMTGKDGVVR